MSTNKHLGVLVSKQQQEQTGDQAQPLLDNQPVLRLIKSEAFDLCSSYNFTAASPRGSTVRPVSISLTDEAANPTSPPISDNVIPLRRRSEMRVDHVTMADSLRCAVELSQRHAVTVFRQNNGMARPAGLPRFSDLGPRIKWWREHRGFERGQFAKMCGMSYSTLASLENNESKKTKKGHIIAAKLRLNAHYLETDEGEPELGVPQEEPVSQANAHVSIPGVPVQEILSLNPDRFESFFLEKKINELIEQVRAERRNNRKRG